MIGRKLGSIMSRFKLYCFLSYTHLSIKHCYNEVNGVIFEPNRQKKHTRIIKIVNRAENIIYCDKT